MRTTSRILLVVASVSVLFVESASAKDTPANFWASDGTYLTVFGGAAFLNDVTHDYVHPATPANNGSTKHGVKSGYLLGLSLGTTLRPNVRGEIELSHSTNSIESQTYSNPAFSASSGSASGKIKTTNLLANMWYDFNPKGQFRPYVGGGIGISLVDAKSLLNGQTVHELNGSDLAFAYQAGAGFRFSASDNIEVDFGYRFRGLTGAKIGTEIFGQTNGRFDTNSHFVQFGISVKLKRM
ncbi:MAG: hypothetical protein COB16_00620 [Rhodobacteraceae bacterium]|nr:MAG: hypothetical protein COB16_00620 [Paracoccaceae bacterium]